jgi:hypothetical protein
VTDANFKLNHMAMKRPEDDVMLIDGEGYFADTEKYEKHIENAVEFKQACDNIFVFDFSCITIT